MVTPDNSNDRRSWFSVSRHGDRTVFPIALHLALIGGAAFTAVSAIEALPLVGMLGGVVEVLLWIGMAGLFVHRAKAGLCALNNPALASMGWAAALGAVTAITGVAASLAVTVTLTVGRALLMAGTGYGVYAPVVVFSGSGPIAGTLLSFLWWPPLGGAVCGLAAVLCSGAMVPRPVRPDWPYRFPADAVATEHPWWQQPSEGRPPVRTTEMPVSPDGRFYWDGTSWRPAGS